MTQKEFESKVKAYFLQRFGYAYLPRIRYEEVVDGSVTSYVAKLNFNNVEKPLMIAGQYASDDEFLAYIYSEIDARRFESIEYFKLEYVKDALEDIQPCEGGSCGENTTTSSDCTPCTSTSETTSVCATTSEIMAQINPIIQQQNLAISELTNLITQLQQTINSVKNNNDLVLTVNTSNLIFEYGTTGNIVTINGTVTQKDASTINYFRMIYNNITTELPYVFGDYNTTQTVGFNDNSNIVLKINYILNNFAYTKEVSATPEFVYPIYYGLGNLDLTSISDATLSKVLTTSSDIVVSLSASDERILLAIPTTKTVDKIIHRGIVVYDKDSTSGNPFTIYNNIPLISTNLELAGVAKYNVFVSNNLVDFTNEDIEIKLV